MSDRFGNITISDGEQKEVSNSTPTPKRSKRTRKNSPSTGSKKKGSGKVLLFLLIPALLFGSYCIVGFYLLPAFITEKLPGILQKKYKIQVSIDSSTFNPLDFRLTFQNISIRHDTKDELRAEFLSIANANLSLSPLSLIRTNFVCENITINNPKLNLIRSQDGSYNISKYISTNKNTSPSEIMDFAELPFLFSLNNVSVSNGEILFQDKPSNKTHTVEQLTLGIPTLSNFFYETPKSVTPHFSAIVNGSPLEILSKPSNLSGGVHTKSTDSFTIELENFNLPQYIEYLPFSFPFQISEGVGKGKIELSFITNDTQEEKLTIQFQLQLDNITTLSEDKSLTAHITSSQLIGTYRPVTNEFSFENIYVQEPKISLFESFSNESIYSVFFNNTEELNTIQKHTPNSIVLVSKLLVDGGTLSKVNPDGAPLTGQGWKQIRFTLKDFKNIDAKKKDKSSRGTFKLSGEKVGSPATFVWDGEFDNNGQPTGNLNISKAPASDVCKSLWQNAATCSTGTANVKGKFTILKPNTDMSPNNSQNYSLKDAEIELQKVRFTEKDKVWLYAEKSNLSVKELKPDGTEISALSISGANIHLHQYFVPKLISKYTEIGGTPLTLNNINIDGALTVHNSNNATPLIIEKFSLKNISNGEKNGQQDLQLTGFTPNNGNITAKGIIQVSPLSCSFSTEFGNIPSEQLLPLFSKNPIAINSKANLSGKGVFSYPHSSFIGSLQTSNAELTTNHKLLSWDNSTFTDISYKAQPFHLGVKKIDIQSPSFTWTRDGDSSSPYDELSSFFNQLLPTKTLSKKRQKDKLPYYKIDLINVFQGEINIVDNRFLYSSEQLVTDIAGYFSDILAPIPTQETSFSFSGNRDNTPFSFSGKGDLLTSPSNGKATYSFSKITQPGILEEVSKSKFYLKGFSTEGRVDSEWFDNQTINNVDVSVRGLLPQESSSTEALTLAFLYKEKPYFKLQYQQTVSPETPGNPLLTAGVANFKTRLIKSQISPILLAEEDYSDLININSLPFEPGSSTLTGETMELLSRFSSLLTSYPLLAINLQGRLSFTEDKKALYDELFKIEQQRIETENDRLFKKWQEEKTKASAKKENETTIDTDIEIIEADLTEPIVHQFIPLTPKPVSVSNNMLSTLATKRAETVYNFLVSDIGISESQLQVKEFSLSNKELLKSGNVKISLTTLFPSKIQQDEIDTIFNNSDQ